MEAGQNVNERVLLVDDEPSVRRMMNDALHKEGYQCRSCANGEDALQSLRREHFDVVITDLYMPGISGMAVLKEGQKVCPESAFLVVTGEQDARIGVEAMKQGALDYLVKPFPVQSLISSVRRAAQKKGQDHAAQARSEYYQNLAAKRTAQLKSAIAKISRSHEATIETLGSLLDIRDSEMAGHAHRVSLYTFELAKRMDLPRGRWKDLVLGAFLHDVGKIGIPSEILSKPDRLTKAEMAVMRTHVTIGYNIVKRIEHLQKTAEIVRSHHERFDGQGYPHGMKGEEIPLEARIFSVADTLDAMTSDRPYRRALPMERAYEEIRACAGRQFDPKVVQVFLSASPRVWEAIRENVQAIQEAMRPGWWDSQIILSISGSIGNLLVPDPMTHAVA
ncbi:MAG: HD domain-containing phosphohydrolase [Terriglobia bacterium]